MKTATTVVQMSIRVIGLIMIVLGVLFWTGNALTLIGLHMLLGIVLVLLLWILSGLAARAGAGLGLAGAGVVAGLIVVAFGMTQSRLLPGDFHWVIKALHLLVGIAALGLAERMAAAIKRRLLSSQPSDRASAAIDAR